jgi:glycosyltransferase involved in cell wall biosynthesis
LRIVFLMPGASPEPVGGTRIIYEHANRLAARGHEVTVIHPVKLEPARRWSKALRLWLRHLSWGATDRWKPSRWMHVDSQVRMLWTRDLKSQRFPLADVVIPITWNTVAPVLELPADRGRRVFYSQHWDFGYGPEDQIRAAWAGPDLRIVINRAAQEAARAMGFDAAYVPNGLDPEAFGIDTPPGRRDPLHVAMLYHPASHKGGADGLKALTLARQSLPGLTAEMFGVAEPPALPAWITYRRGLSDTDLRSLYNRASIFISASANEGWGLAPCEAGFCGCAIAVADNFGHREFAIDGKTALVSAVGDIEALAANIVRLAQDRALRERLNADLREKLAEFSWNRSSELFEQALTGV